MIDKILEKVNKRLHRFSELMEIVMAYAVLLGIVIAALALIPEIVHYWNNRTVEGAFQEYLEAVFNVVIGIEFFKMLCKLNTANIIEVLILLIARHMIVSSTTPVEDLISVISISILFLFRRIMRATNPDGDPEDGKKMVAGIKDLRRRAIKGEAIDKNAQADDKEVE